MMNITKLTINRTWILLSVLFAGGCASTSPNSQFYMLTPLQHIGSVDASTQMADKYIIVGPVNLPKYLDRPHIVTRSANAEVYLSDVHRWAEPVQYNFTRVLAENLSQLLGSEKISIAPSRDRAIADYRITMEVLRFDSNRTTGEVILTAYWNINTDEAVNPVTMRKSEHKLQASGNADYAELVDVMSSAIEQLSREIADTIKQH